MFGLVGLVQASASLQTALMIAATIYLLWLAWTIAAAPIVGAAIGDRESASLTSKGAFFLGAFNPKAYLAFASLFGSFTLASTPVADGGLKWGLTVAVIIVVDLIWLMLGMAFGRIAMSAPSERVFNIAMGLSIAAACVGTWL